MPTRSQRDIKAFNEYSDWIFANAHTRDDEMRWLEMQGPWCPALLEYLERHHRSYDALIFFTYLYAPTVLGLKIDPSRSILVPTAHDEPAIHLEIYKEMFRLPSAIAYNTESEKNFLKIAFDIRAIAEETVGCGVDLLQGESDSAVAGAATDTVGLRTPADDAGDDVDVFAQLKARGVAFRRRHRLQGQFLLYGGRIDAGKGCEELLEYFTSYKEHGGDAVTRADGRQADADTGGAMGAVRRASVGARTSQRARGRDGRRGAVAVREPLAPSARGDGRRHARAVQRAQRGTGRPLPEEQRRALLRESR